MATIERRTRKQIDETERQHEEFMQICKDIRGKKEPNH
jgi:hypothetical protein